MLGLELLELDLDMESLRASLMEFGRAAFLLGLLDLMDSPSAGETSPLVGFGLSMGLDGSSRLVESRGPLCIVLSDTVEDSADLLCPTTEEAEEPASV